MKINTLEVWHHVVKEGDIEALDGLLSDSAEFHSPIVHTPQKGKLITIMYLSAAFGVLVNKSFHYVREIVDQNGAILEFMVEIDGITVNGVDMLTWDDDGKIIEFKVMLRPLKAIQLIHQKMAAILKK